MSWKQRKNLQNNNTLLNGMPVYQMPYVYYNVVLGKTIPALIAAHPDLKQKDL